MQKKIIDTKKEYNRQLFKIFYKEWKRGKPFIILREDVKEKKEKTTYGIVYKSYKKLPGNFQDAINNGMRVFDFSCWKDEKWEAMRKKLWGCENEEREVRKG